MAALRNGAFLADVMVGGSSERIRRRILGAIPGASERGRHRGRHHPKVSKIAER
jgi:hypothetical protein